MEKGIRMEPLYKGRGDDIVSPANIDKAAFSLDIHTRLRRQRQIEKKMRRRWIKKRNWPLLSTRRSDVATISAAAIHMWKDLKKENNNNQIVPFPFYLAGGLFFPFLVYRRSSGGKEFRGRRVQLWRVSAHLSMTHGHLKFINSLYALASFFLIESSRHMPDSIRFDSILLLAFFWSTSWHFSHFVLRHKVGPFLYKPLKWTE